ncbi:MAG: hypothetical protein NkDv07_0377 [Candidatus Improbicoccus devescovinae]|nr:MAG: hypothetical protein NkDv07_0377 [Candidatus Improbicoccus devescovinae]
MSDESEKMKNSFFKRKKKLHEFVPSKEKKHSKLSDRLGYFKSKFGVISVGYDKLKQTEFGFTILSKNSKLNKKNLVEKGFQDDHNYLGRNFESKNEKNIKYNNSSFIYDAKSGQIREINENKSDNKLNTNYNVLYDNDEDNKTIEDIKKLRTSGVERSSEVESAISDLRVVQKEKQNDNLDFYKQIKKFVELFLKHKLKKFEDSDEIKKSKNRIIGVPGGHDIIWILKKRLEEILKSGELDCAKTALEVLESYNLSSYDKDFILNYFKKLINL